MLVCGVAGWQETFYMYEVIERLLWQWSALHSRARFQEPNKQPLQLMLLRLHSLNWESVKKDMKNITGDLDQRANDELENNGKSPGV